MVEAPDLLAVVQPHEVRLGRRPLVVQQARRVRRVGADKERTAGVLLRPVPLALAPLLLPRALLLGGRPAQVPLVLVRVGRGGAAGGVLESPCVRRAAPRGGGGGDGKGGGGG